MLYYDADTSCDHKYCDDGDMFLICHVTSREQIFKELYEFMGGSRSQWVTILPYLVATDLLQVEILSI